MQGINMRVHAVYLVPLIGQDFSLVASGAELSREFTS